MVLQTLGRDRVQFVAVVGRLAEQIRTPGPYRGALQRGFTLFEQRHARRPRGAPPFGVRRQAVDRGERRGLLAGERAFGAGRGLQP